MNNSNNLTAQTKGQFSYNRKQVQYLCGITEAQFLDFQCATACDFINHYGSQLSNPDAVLNSTAFLNWWCYHWNHIDDISIIGSLYAVVPETRYGYYRQMHQYVFDPTSGHGEHFLKDFRDMRKVFEAALKEAI